MYDNETLTATWTFDGDSVIESAKAALKAAGYVVHKEKSWRQLLERVRVAECLRKAAEEYRESTQRWAETTLHNEIRDLQARCTFLYGMARAKGATINELAGGWQPVGLNLPTERATTMKCHCGIHPFMINEGTGGNGIHFTQFVCPEHGLVDITSAQK
jgi:hypothetical protein